MHYENLSHYQDSCKMLCCLCLCWQVHPEEERPWSREARVQAQGGGKVRIYRPLNDPTTILGSWKEIVAGGSNPEFCLSGPDSRLWHSSDEKPEAYPTWSKREPQYENRTRARSKYWDCLLEYVARPPLVLAWLNEIQYPQPGPANFCPSLNNFSLVELWAASINIRPFRPMVTSQHAVLRVFKVCRHRSSWAFPSVLTWTN